jgi:hypothetical protein
MTSKDTARAKGTSQIRPAIKEEMPLNRSNKRDEFPRNVIQLLEQQAGSRCCNPGCHQPTRAQSWDGQRAINIGAAAHIHAAAPGGARYDAAMTSEQRKSHENGIWMCRNCATLIDTDEAGFPADLIREWKQKSLGQRRDDLIVPISKRHRVEQSSAPIASDPDRVRYEQILKEMGSNSSGMHALNKFGGGWAFERSALYDPLIDFLAKWTAPENTFNNPTIQSALISFTSAISLFMDYLSHNTWACDGNAEWSNVPSEWEDRYPKRWDDVVKSLDAHANACQVAHANLIRTAKEQLRL